MSTKRDRYFIDRGGPLMQRMAEIRAARVASQDALRAFMAKHGVTQMYGTRPPYSCDFEKPSDADMLAWAKTKPRRGEYFYRPRRNTPQGKALGEEMKSLPECPSYDNAVETVPGLFRFPVVIEDGCGYSPYVRFCSVKAGFAILSVPWRDKTREEIDAYKANKNYMSAEMDFAQWQPPEWLEEVKEWEALKLIDENRESP